MDSNPYTSPYPEAVEEITVEVLSDIPESRWFLVRADGVGYWGGPGQSDGRARDNAYVYNREQVIPSFESIIIGKTLELLPELESDEMTPAEAAEVNELLQEPLAGEAENKPAEPSEVTLSPGQVLFQSLKSNPGRALEDWTANKGSVLKYIADAFKSQSDDCNYSLEVEKVVPTSANISVCAVALRGDSKAISTTDYTALLAILRRVGTTLGSFGTIPPSEAKKKLVAAIQKSQGF